MVGTEATVPCAACRWMSRKCFSNCVFAPYFPREEAQKYEAVHRVFGANNVSKMLQDVPEDQRSDAVKSLVYEADARIKDPVHGSFGTISALREEVVQLQIQLAISQAQLRKELEGHSPKHS